jgi:hypothetical protein
VLLRDAPKHAARYDHDGYGDESIPPYYPALAIFDGQFGPNTCNTAHIALFIRNETGSN